MKKQIKTIIELHSTKRDMYGNVYHVAEITNARTGKMIATSTPSGFRNLTKTEAK